MRRTRLAALMVCVCALLFACALAEDAPALPRGMAALCEDAGYTVAAYDGWGDEARGQYALALVRDGRSVLAVAEKAADDAAYAFTIENHTALPDGDPPRLLIDTGGDALFWSCTLYGKAHTFHAVKDADGWGAVDLNVDDDLNHAELAMWAAGGLLWQQDITTDGEGNILRITERTPLPAEGLDVSLARFDISDFPLVFNDWLASHPAQLKPLLGDIQVRYGCVTPMALMLFGDSPEGQPQLALCQWSEGWTCTRVALPEGASFDDTHSWSSAIIGWPRDGQHVSYSFAPRSDGLWGLSYAMGEEWFAVGEDYIALTDPETGEERRCYGTLPWGDIRAADWASLPSTTAEALAVLDRRGWAMVDSDDPANRLHLRDLPSREAKSLGKYYRGTPVRVREEQGDWTLVSVYGIEGWMMRKYLVFGEKMDELSPAFPQLMLREDAQREGASVYASPSESAAVLERRRWADWNDAQILGVVGDDWYHVRFDDTASGGYMRQSAFWPGNG